MGQQDYVAPTCKAPAYHCPYCEVFANQRWSKVYIGASNNTFGTDWQTSYDAAACDSCGKLTMWLEQKMVVPDHSIAPPSATDMPQDVIRDYEEARSVFSKSPRSSTALLRLAVQKLCKDLGGSGSNLNADIGLLVQRGLPVEVQQALDVVRVIGNNQVHPGTLDVRDDPQTAAALFGLINFIVEVMITRPKQIQALFGKLPVTAHQQIQQRDAKKP